MSRNLLFLALLSLVISGCAEAPINVGNNNVEKPLADITGVSTEDVEKTAQKPALNLMDVYALAVKHTETLASYYENLLQAKAQQSQAIGAALPQVAINGTKGFYSTSFVPAGTGNPLFNPASTTAYFSAAETILSGLSEPAAIQGADASIRYQNENLRYQSQQLLLNVAKAFYNVLQLKESQAALETSRDLNQQILELEKQWQVIGRSRTADVSNTEAQLMQVLADLENDKYQLSQAAVTLATLANIKPDQPLVSEETYAAPNYTLEGAEAKVEDRPDVKSAAASVVVADAGLLLATGTHFPSIVAVGDYYVNYDKVVGVNEWNVLLEASLPLFDGGQGFSEEDMAASKKRQAELQLSLTRRTALYDIRAAYKSLSDSMAETDAYQKAVDAYEQDYKDVLHDLKLNLTTNLELLQVMTSLESARVSYIQAKYQTLYDWVWLQVATGELPKVSGNGQ